MYFDPTRLAVLFALVVFFALMWFGWWSFVLNVTMATCFRGWKTVQEQWARDNARDEKLAELQQTTDVLEFWKMYAEYLEWDVIISADRQHLHDMAMKVAAKINGAYAAIRKHRDERGDDRCWMDDEELYNSLPEGYTPPERDTLVELKNCEKYIACRHNPATAYVSPEREIERLQRDLRRVADLCMVYSEFPCPVNPTAVQEMLGHIGSTARGGILPEKEQ